MSKVFIEESTLTAIGDAIREKTGGTELIPPLDMASEIEGITTGDLSREDFIPDEALIVGGDCKYKFAYSGWNWFLEMYGKEITTQGITDASYMFYNNKLTEFPLTEITFSTGGCNVNMMFGLTDFEEIPSIDFNQTVTYKDINSIFQSTQAKSIGTLKNLYPSNISGMFKNAQFLRYLPEFENLNLGRVQSYIYSNAGNIFENCYSIRTISEDFLKELWGIWTSYYSAHFNSMFAYCYALDEIRGLNPKTGTMTTNMFSGTFNSCDRAKELIFATQDDGTPYSVNWKGQTIDLTRRFGWSNYNSSSDLRAMCILKNSGITIDKEVINDATYQALKDDADWFTCDVAYSRYNHDSAVNTINSLPDTSAYLATAGGTNTIKFKGDAGIHTDGGAINTLTAEEIAVATAKGWTVTLV